MANFISHLNCHYCQNQLGWDAEKCWFVFVLDFQLVMKLNKKEIAIIFAIYFICASSILLNANLILIKWKQRKREKNW